MLHIARGSAAGVNVGIMIRASGIMCSADNCSLRSSVWYRRSGRFGQIGAEPAWGSKALKWKLAPIIVLLWSCPPIDGVRVPGINKIHLIEQPACQLKLFGTAPPLCRTAKIDDCPLFEGFQIFLDSNGCQAPAPRTVSTSVARCSWMIGCLVGQAAAWFKPERASYSPRIPTTGFPHP